MRVFRQKGCKAWRVRFSVAGLAYDLPLKTRLKEVAYERARQLLREKKLEEAGLLAPKVQRDVAKVPLSDLLKQWVATGLAPDVGKKHRTYSLNRPQKVFEECSWKFVRDIRAQDFETWRSAQYRDGLSPKTLNEYLGHLRTFVSWMEEREMIGANPLRSVKRLPVPKKDPLRAFTLEELRKLIEVVPAYRSAIYRIAPVIKASRASRRWRESAGLGPILARNENWCQLRGSLPSGPAGLVCRVLALAQAFKPLGYNWRRIRSDFQSAKKQEDNAVH